MRHLAAVRSWLPEQHLGTEHFRAQLADLTGFAVDLISDDLPSASYDAIRATTVPL